MDNPPNGEAVESESIRKHITLPKDTGEKAKKVQTALKRKHFADLLNFLILEEYERLVAAGRIIPEEDPNAPKNDSAPVACAA